MIRQDTPGSIRASAKICCKDVEIMSTRRRNSDHWSQELRASRQGCCGQNVRCYKAMLPVDIGKQQFGQFRTLNNSRGNA